MANVFEKISSSIKSVISSFLADDYESESDIKTVLLKASKDGDISPDDALVLAAAYKVSNDGAIQYIKSQESLGRKTKKSQKKYTNHKDKESSTITPRAKGIERDSSK